MCGKNSKFVAAVLLFTFSLGLTPASFAENANEPGFKGETDVGSTITTGNTRSQNITAKTSNKYRFDANVLSFGGRYLNTKDAGAETARYWDAEARYARDISAWHSAYVGWKAESDPYAGYVQRDSADIGLHSVLTDDDTFDWFVEVGFRHSKTHNVADEAYDNFLRLYTEATKEITKTTSAKIWVEHLPNLKNDAAYLTNAEISMTVVVSEIVSLKTSYLSKFQNAPPATFEKTDGTFITALVAKY